MFPRVLFIDKDRALELNWLGLGALQVRARAGPVRRAHPMQKEFFRQFFREFERLGQPVAPANPMCSVAMREFAERIETSPPTSPGWLFLYAIGPQAYAASFIASETQSVPKARLIRSTDRPSR